MNSLTLGVMVSVQLNGISRSLPGIPYRNFTRPCIPHETLFAIGILPLHSYTNYMQMYDTRANRWVKVEEMEPVIERSFFGTAVVGFNIYVIGGVSLRSFLNSCRCFNVVSKTWCEMSPMHRRRCQMSVAVLDELVYVIGGHGGCRTAERYDYRTNR
jgi:kelch-like protein 10